MDYTNAHLTAWQAACDLLEQNVPSAAFRAWIKPLKLHAVTVDSVILEAPDPFVIENLRRRYMTMIASAINMSFGRNFELVIALKSDLEKQDIRMSGTMLNQKYTFDNFIVGQSNSFAYNASLAVAEEPNSAYNPLFIYGGVGLGKTHLMNAIGNYILSLDPLKNVLFISSETFTNQFIETIVKKKGTNDLREKMRSVDVLMVDDIQFLSKTTATQEEFFHTFNELYSKGKQIILSSDRPPKEIPTIEERLRSRFSCGLIVDVRKPDFETRLAILARKCEDENIDCGRDILEYIAGRVESNIRDLEGALNRVSARISLMGGSMDLESAMAALEDILPQNTSRAVTPQIILDCVAERYDVKSADLTSKKRNKEFIMPRQIAMYLMREMTQLSTTAIGRELGDRDHTTVMHGCEKITQSLKSDPTFKKNLDELRQTIEGH